MLQLQVQTIKELREKAAPLPPGIGPYVSSQSFKLTSPNLRPKAARWTKYFSQEAHNHVVDSLKASSRTVGPTSLISLGTGRPNPQLYPLNSMVVQGSATEARPEAEIREKSVAMFCSKGDPEYDLGIALNYGYAAGSPQLLRYITEHVELIHDPPYQDWECSVTCGTTSALDILLRMLCDRGSGVIVEQYTYPLTTKTITSQGLKPICVKMDEHGLLPVNLDAILSDWDDSNGPKPRLLYTIPCGQNPTGITQDAHRRQKVYEVAEKHDLLILEDDPYYFIQLRDIEVFSLDTYIDSLTPSYLSIDVSGRVLRLDSTSKILGPGLRCGWITGCSEIIHKFLSFTEISTMSPNGLAQVVLYKLLDETWGHDGFIAWLIHLSAQYRHRLKALDEACCAHLPLQLCQWTLPSYGMFLWVKVDITAHPQVKDIDRPHYTFQRMCLDIEERIYVQTKTKGTLIARGSWFAGNREDVCELWFRLTFAAAEESAFDRAAQSFGSAICNEFEIV